MILGHTQMFECWREKNYRNALESCTCHGLDVKILIVLFFLLRKGLTIIDLFEALWWGHVSPLAPVLGPGQKKTGCVTLFHLFMAASMILKMWHSGSYCMRHSWQSQFGTISLNQLVSAGISNRFPAWYPIRTYN